MFLEAIIENFLDMAKSHIEEKKTARLKAAYKAMDDVSRIHALIVGTSSSSKEEEQEVDKIKFVGDICDKMSPIELMKLFIEFTDSMKKKGITVVIDNDGNPADEKSAELFIEYVFNKYSAGDISEDSFLESSDDVIETEAAATEDVTTEASEDVATPSETVVEVVDTTPIAVLPPSRKKALGKRATVSMAEVLEADEKKRRSKRSSSKSALDKSQESDSAEAESPEE